MAYIPGSSFIPKETTIGATPKVVRRKRTFHVVGFVGSLLLVLSILAALGVFGYKKYLENQLLVVQEELKQQKSQDMEKKLKDIAIFDRQLNTAVHLLDNHIAPTRVFSALESLTKETVVFNSFKYTYDPGNIVKVDVQGGTEKLTSLAVQKLEIATKDLFDEFSVSDIALNLTEGPEASPESKKTDEAVGFSITGMLRKDSILYTGDQSFDSFETQTIESTEDESLSTDVDTTNTI